MRLRTIIAWSAFIVTGLLVGLGLIVLFSLPFDTTKPLMDHLARDGHADRFSVSFISQWALWLKGVGALTLVVVAIFLVFRRRSIGWTGHVLDGIECIVRRLAADGRSMTSGFHIDWAWSVGVGLIMAVGVITTLHFLGRPMGHDEAYTFMAFARQPFSLALSDYPLPNNHLFHTFWLYLAYHLLGSAPWVVRLPAFIAGILLIPVIYSLGSRLYSKPVGLIAAALVAASYEVLLFETSARGYTLLALLSILFLLLSWTVKNHRNLAAWLLWGLAAALGFYTVPVFLYAFGAVVAWLFLSMVFGDFKDYPSRMDFLGYLVISGILAGALTFLLYLPVFLHHQSFKVVFGNQFIESMSWEDFQVTAPIRLRETWQAWIGGFDPLVLDALIAGFFLSILLHWNISNSRIPLQLAAAAWLIPLVFIQRVQLWTKTWFFLLPLILLWCAAGLVGLAQLIFRRIPYGRWIHAALIAAEVGVVLYGGWQVRQTEYDHARSPGMEEQFVMYLQEHLREGDIIISNWISEPAISYYLLQYQIPVNKMFVKALPFKQAYVIVNQEININIQDVLHDRGLDPRIFKIDQAIVVQQRGNSTMYLVPVN